MALTGRAALLALLALVPVVLLPSRTTVLVLALVLAVVAVVFALVWRAVSKRKSDR